LAGMAAGGRVIGEQGAPLCVICGQGAAKRKSRQSRDWRAGRSGGGRDVRGKGAAAYYWRQRAAFMRQKRAWPGVE